MLTLLRRLRRLRTDVGLPAPTRGRSLALRHVDAGSCNGCEHELTLAMSPYEDVQRYGFGIVASPRHADVLLVTGTVTTRMREPLLAAYNAMPEPRRVVALGDCAPHAASSLPKQRSLAPSRRFYRSPCAYPAAHPRRARSRKRCSNCTTPATVPQRTEQFALEAAAWTVNRQALRQPPRPGQLGRASYARAGGGAEPASVGHLSAR
jgi:hypothetical protein